MAEKPDNAEHRSVEVEVYTPSKGGYKRSVTETVEVDAPPPTPAPPPAKPAEAAPAQPAPPPPAPPRAVKPQAAPSPPASAAKAAEASKPKPKMPPDPEGQGKVLAESVVGSFVGALTAKANERGGHLLPEDIHALSESFKRQTQKLAATFSRCISSYAESHAESHWDPERTNAFERVLVKQFSHLLSDDASVAKDINAIPRRVLPGVFAAVQMMAGHEVIEQFEQNAYLVMQRVRDDNQDEFRWETVYADPRIKNMVRELVVNIAPHFVDLPRRLEWLSAVINGHLAPVDSHSLVADWLLSEPGLLRIIDALFDHARELLDDDMGRLRLTKDYGVETLETLIAVLEGFDQHKNAIAGAH